MMDGDANRSLVVADLFFGLAAILLIVLALFAADLRAMLGARAPGAADTRAAAAALATSAAPVLLAEAGGVRIAPGDTVVPLDEVLGAAALGWVLGAAPLVVVKPDGTEAAFLLSARAARAGIARLDVVYLPGGCRGMARDGAGGVTCTR